jgi:hypothetical protein
MRALASKAYRAVLRFAAWGWPILIADFATGAVNSEASWARALNTAAFAWVLAACAWPAALLFDRSLRERAMARLCGLRENDERERAVTGEAARSALLLSLALQTVLIAMTLTQVKASWNPELPGPHKGMLSVGLGFSTESHLDPFGHKADESDPAPRGVSAGGYLLSPSVFPVLAVLMLIQLAAFRLSATRRYEGLDG